MKKLIPAPSGADLEHIAPDLRINAVEIEPLLLDPENPRRGDIELIAKSFDRHGQQQPVIVYRFPISPEHPVDGFTVIAGNHRCKGALLETLNGESRTPWKYIAVSEYIGTPQEAQEYAIIDNRSSDVAEYDDKILAKHLRDISAANTDADLYDLTGYDEGDLTYYLSRMEISEDQKENTHNITAPVVIKKEEKENKLKNSSTNTSAKFTFNVAEYIDKEEKYPIFPFSSSYGYGIPDLIPSMLAEVPDKPVRVWPGYTHRTADYIQKYEEKKDYWLVNFGYSSQNCPFDRAYLCFYALDEVFEGVYFNPEKFAKNFSGAGIKAIIEPDYSTWYGQNVPFVINLWSNYRQRWLGRYFQEVGIKVIPNIGGVNKEPYMFESLPPYCPVVATQIQTGLTKKDLSPDSFMNQIYKNKIKTALKLINTDCFIVYGSKLGHTISKNWFPKSLHVIRVATVQDVRRQTYRKDPLRSLKTKDYN